MYKDLLARINELERIVANLVRPGTVAGVQLGAAPRVQVTIGENSTGWLPWCSGRAGSTIEYSPLSEGEQVLVLSPNGDFSAGYVLPSIYQNSAPSPQTSGTVTGTKYADGATILYDSSSSALAVQMPGGSATVMIGGLALSVSGSGVTITGGTLTVSGTITSTGGDVVAGSISLTNHTHTDPQGGTSGPAAG